MDYSNLFVCLMGIGTVFFGLICLVGISYLTSALCREKKPAEIQQQAAQPASAGRGELVAAISAALAEDLGTDITGLRIYSIKKL